MDENIIEKISRFIDVSNLGVLLGDGISTVAINCYNEFDLSEKVQGDVVMIITSDKTKQTFYEETFRNTDVIIEDYDYEIKDYDEATEAHYVLNILSVDAGLDIFYMTKLNSVEFDGEDNEFLIEMDRSFSRKTFYSGEIPTLFLENIKTTSTYLSTLKEAVIASIKVANDVFGNGSYVSDIHDGQFLEYSGQIFCIDPVIKR